MFSILPPAKVSGCLAALALASAFTLYGCASEENPSLTPTPATPAATSAPVATSAPAAAPESSESPTEATDRPPQRDWVQCPAIAEIGANGDILVVGDAHGDWEKLRALLVGAGVIAGPAPEDPADARWIAGDATLVLVGDFSGKFPQSLQVIELIQTLQKQAEGRVIATMGNHEAEFLTPKIKDGKPKWKKKTKIFRQELADNQLVPEDIWLVRGDERSQELGAFLRCIPLAASSEHWFFSHAGSTGGRTLDALIRDIEEGVEDSGYRTAVLLDEETGLIEARLPKKKNEDGLRFWCQEAEECERPTRQRLEGYAEALGVRHMVVGHQSGKYTFKHEDGEITRNKARVFQLFDGTLYLVDVGMSRGQSKEEPKTGLSAGALLKIRRQGDAQTVTVVCPDGRDHPLPPEGDSAGLRCKL